MHIKLKSLRLNHLTIRSIFFSIQIHMYMYIFVQYIYISPVQVSHLFQLVTKQLHYFYANRAKYVVVYIILYATRNEINGDDINNS